MKTQTSKVIEVLPETAFELFGESLCQFRQHLLNQSYSESTVKQYMCGIDSLAKMMKAQKIPLEELDESQALELVVKIDSVPKRRTQTTSTSTTLASQTPEPSRIAESCSASSRRTPRGCARRRTGAAVADSAERPLSSRRNCSAKRRLILLLSGRRP